jgi:spore germination cell wall hydrolase CwlJ-like protein
MNSFSSLAKAAAALALVSGAAAPGAARAAPPGFESARFSAMEEDCLSLAIYYEARSESDLGQEAVAQVVLNRVKDPAYPNDVCGVVFQGSERRTGCQFSFTCDGSMARLPEGRAWAKAKEIAAAAIEGRASAPVSDATHYHTTAILPYWASSLIRLKTIGAHIFYAKPGAGEPRRVLTPFERVEQVVLSAMDEEVTISVHRGSTRGGSR